MDQSQTTDHSEEDNNICCRNAQGKSSRNFPLAFLNVDISYNTNFVNVNKDTKNMKCSLIYC